MVLVRGESSTHRGREYRGRCREFVPRRHAHIMRSDTDSVGKECTESALIFGIPPIAFDTVQCFPLDLSDPESHQVVAVAGEELGDPRQSEQGVDRSEEGGIDGRYEKQRNEYENPVSLELVQRRSGGG